MDVESHEWRLARRLGADRAELYTAPYAVAHARNESALLLAAYGSAAAEAQGAGLGVNAFGVTIG